MSGSTTLKKITAEAKRIRKKSPGMKWLSAVKQAGAKYRGGKLGGKKKATKRRPVARKGSSKRSAPRKRAAPRVARRPSGSVASHISEVKKLLKERLGRALVAKDQAKGIRNKKLKGKTVAAIKAQLRKLS